MDPSIPTSLESAAKTIYKKVIKQALTSRNPGKVAVCCYSFFSRAKAAETNEHLEVITATSFCQQYQIKSEMDFINHCKSKNLSFDPQLNNSECRKRDKTEKIISELRTELASLKAQLEEKGKQLEGFTVGSDKPVQ